jgi:hypothetical protein
LNRSVQSDRPLTSSERELIDRLLEPDFPGRDQLREQLTTARAVEIEDGGLSFICDTTVRAPVKSRVPTEGEYQDADGVTVHLLLHVVDGILRELEIFKDDSSPVVNKPVPSTIDVTAPFSA